MSMNEVSPRSSLQKRDRTTLDAEQSYITNKRILSEGLKQLTITNTPSPGEFFGLPTSPCDPSSDGAIGGTSTEKIPRRYSFHSVCSEEEGEVELEKECYSSESDSDPSENSKPVLGVRRKRAVDDSTVTNKAKSPKLVNFPTVAFDAGILPDYLSPNPKTDFILREGGCKEVLGNSPRSKRLLQGSSKKLSDSIEGAASTKENGKCAVAGEITHSDWGIEQVEPNDDMRLTDAHQTTAVGLDTDSGSGKELRWILRQEGGTICMGGDDNSSHNYDDEDEDDNEEEDDRIDGVMKSHSNYVASVLAGIKKPDRTRFYTRKVDFLLDEVIRQVVMDGAVMNTNMNTNEVNTNEMNTDEDENEMKTNCIHENKSMCVYTGTTGTTIGMRSVGEAGIGGIGGVGEVPLSPPCSETMDMS